MRRGAILVLLALILLVAFFGLLEVLGILLAVAAVSILLLFVALAVGVWLLKRRMRRKLAELRTTLERAHAEAGERRRREAGRRDAIDVEARDVRDGDGHRRG